MILGGSVCTETGYESDSPHLPPFELASQMVKSGSFPKKEATQGSALLCSAVCQLYGLTSQHWKQNSLTAPYGLWHLWLKGRTAITHSYTGPPLKAEFHWNDGSYIRDLPRTHKERALYNIVNDNVVEVVDFQTKLSNSQQLAALKTVNQINQEFTAIHLVLFYCVCHL